MATQILAGSNTAKRAKKPVSAHPAFKIIVALWFAALLGIGSLILPITLIERFVVAVGLPDILAAAQPPLGFTARGAIAISFTVIGALIGLFAARQIARSTTREAPARAIKPSDFARRQPLQAHEELGQGGFDAVATLDKTPAARRRSLTLTEEERPSEFLQAAPLPGHDDEDYVEFDDEDDALDLAVELTQDDTGTPFATPIFTENQDMPQHDAASTQLHEDNEMADPQDFTEPFAESATDDSAQTEIRSFGQAPAAAELQAESGHEAAADPLPFSPPSMAVPPPTAEQAPAPGILQSSALAAQLARETGANADVPLAELGLVQLVQRLATTIEKHREWSASKPADAPTPAPAAPSIAPVALAAASAHPGPLTGVDSADESEAVEARSAYFSAPPAAPAEQPQASDSAETVSDSADPVLPAKETVRQEFMAPPANPASSQRPLAPLASLAPRDDEDEDEDDEDGQMAALAASFALPTPPLRKVQATQLTALPGAFDKPEPVAPARPESEARMPEHDGADGRPANDQIDDTQGDDTQGDDTQAQDDGFASLARLSNPFTRPAQEFVRIEDEPEQGAAKAAVVFPGKETGPATAPASASNGARAFDPPGSSAANAHRASGDETDRALRDALMNLQRMGKAG